MRPPTPRHAALLATVLALAACASPTAPPADPTGARRVTPRSSSSAAVPLTTPTPVTGLVSPTPPAQPSATPLAIASLPPTALITLAGIVRAPSTLLSDNGGGLISDHGGSLIGNNGSGYRLRQVATSVVAPGLKVGLFDARGAAVNGPDGQPLTAFTAADGSYVFTAAIPTDHNLVVRVVSGTGTSNGELSRLLVRGLKTADIDLASSLVARYVLREYVSTQADPQATLDKLPADAEAKTVALALPAAAPANLAPDVVAAAATSLRGANGAFDAQMEVVKKLLIAAGVSNLGEGLPASDVYMRRLFGSDIAADGTLYTLADDDHLLWRVDAAGKLSAVAGNGERPVAATPKARDGLKANAVALDFVWTVHVDDAGRPMLSENEHGVWRIESDGTITVLHTPEAMVAAYGASRPGRGLHVRSDGTLVAIGTDGKVWALPPGGTRTQLADAGSTRAGMAFTELPGGAGWLAMDWEVLVHIKPTGAPETIFADDDPRLRLVTGSLGGYTTLDARGNYFYVAAADGKIHRRRPDGTDEAVAERTSLSLGLAWAREGRDGKIYVADCNMGDNLGAAIVRRYAAGSMTVIAGIDGLPKGFTADGRIALLYPGGLDVAPDGTLWITDAGALVRLAPGGQPTLVAAKGTQVPGVGAVTFTGVRRLDSGKLAARAFSTSREVVLLQTDTGWDVGLSTPKTIGNPWNIIMNGWDAKPDGTLVASVHGYAPVTFDAQVSVLYKRPGSPQEVLVPTSAGFRDVGKLVFGTDGQLWMRGGKTDYTSGRYLIAANGTVTNAPEGARMPEVLDPQGRALEGDAPTGTLGNYGDRKIYRKELSGTWGALAGAGTALFGGSLLDDSIGWAEDLRYDSAGNLYVRDVLRRQVRRIPKDRL